MRASRTTPVEFHDHEAKVAIGFGGQVWMFQEDRPLWLETVHNRDLAILQALLEHASDAVSHERIRRDTAEMT
jgi:hypothetical protein